MANGDNALYSNTTGFFNMANGACALLHNTTGNYNMAEGLNALFSNTTGSNNIALGISPEPISPPVVTISISATVVSRASPETSVSAPKDHRPAPTSLGLAE